MLDFSFSKDLMLSLHLKIEEGPSIVLLHENKQKVFVLRNLVLAHSQESKQIGMLNLHHDGYLIHKLLSFLQCDGLNFAHNVSAF